MITPNLTSDQLQFLLYGVCDESYEAMTRLVRMIDQLCQTRKILWCEELFLPLEIGYPEELRCYGWKEPKRYLDEGYFYLYQGSGKENDNMWHIECPLSEKLEKEFKRWRTQKS